ncbi:hypothetical protein KC343_g2202 [Hortaea werneckii]|nr:hypothetical protein KC323_g6066 [Hortaea werneckii]KAI6864202.1 hypothetical protein KC338_g5577 [Hortaea werneckii]KAI7257204.1 hypothetical protein KC352_g11001 [Hortaea werneckii]KAI7352032.1 hypothetical protein KC320_g4681 [Hortaea werneckii]KAI7570452.1 hypothetical protein KC317_g2454 [Hortaea werneckii]
MALQAEKAALAAYSTCDISDALLKLKHPLGGFLPGLSMWSPGRHSRSTKILGPAYTVKFVKHEEKDAPILPKHYIDTVPAGAVVFISAPRDIPHAVYGGLMSHRAIYSGAVGTVVDGNFRDLDEQRNLGYPVNVSVSFPGNLTTATIEPGDFIVGDLNGVVHIPTHLLPQIMDILPTIVSADELVAADIDRGVTFKEASNTHRKK